MGSNIHSMPDSDRNHSFKAVLLDAAKRGKTVRFFSHTGSILAEGIIADVGENVVALKHRGETEPDEFLLMSAIVKVQLIPEPRTF